MRPGLVGLGIAFLVIGGTAIASLYAFPAGPASTQIVTGSSIVSLQSGVPVQSELLWGINASRATFGVTWSSPIAVDGTLYSVNATCSDPGTCSTPPVLIVDWNGETSGSWNTSRNTHFPYYLEFRPTSKGSGIVQVSTRSETIDAVTAPLVPELLATLAGAIVIVIGGVALFLGLFLRRDPYGPPPPPRAHPNTDVETQRWMDDGAPPPPRGDGPN
jgi:hypothetical protein